MLFSHPYKIQWRWWLVGFVILGSGGLTQSLNTDSAPLRPFIGVATPIRATVTGLGLTPAQVKAAYQLPSASSGSGTIAIIDAYDDPTIETDLGVFDKKFGLRNCTLSNGCFDKHKLSASVATSTDWSGEIALDVEWAHAIAPGAKILLVEAVNSSRTSLLKAVDYARQRPDVVAISMSWGGSEFSTETREEGHFTSANGATFFASSGDDGYGVSWPAASANVVAVGGTSLHFSATGSVSSETAWSGSGGGLSANITAPSYQTGLDFVTNHRRAVPDVSYNANPNSGYVIYDATGSGGWAIVGGTSAGAPQWAALKAINHNLSLTRLYAAKTSLFRDITSGSNGSCGVACKARPGYDLVTGLGSPLTAQF